MICDKNAKIKNIFIYLILKKLQNRCGKKTKGVKEKGERDKKKLWVG